MSDNTNAIGWNPKLKYPDNDAATKLADDVEKKEVADGKSKTGNSWAAYQAQNKVIEDVGSAGKFVALTTYNVGKGVIGIADQVEAVETGAKALYHLASGEPGKVKQDTGWYAAKALLHRFPLTSLAMKGVDGTVGLIESFNYAKSIGQKDVDAKLQVFHNERVDIDVHRYLADHKLISKGQYEASLKGLSPFGEHYAKGNGSPIDEHAAKYAAAIKEKGLEKQIAGEVREGKLAAVRFDIKTSGDIGKAMLQSPDFKKAYQGNAVFRAGVNALVDEYAHDRAKYDKDVAELTPPPPPPVKG